MKIHTVWLGPGRTSELADRCMATWPDNAEIWTAARMSSVVPWVRDIEHFRAAYAAGHWAGASDVARFALLWELGGCYLDVDVEIVNLSYLQHIARGADFALGMESEQHVCGAVVLAKPRARVCAMLLDYYRATPFASVFGSTGITGTTILTKILCGAEKGDAAIMQPKVFYPWHWGENISDEEKTKRKAQFGVACAHHWEGSWAWKSGEEQ